jgi:hypothetical protein
MPARSRLASLLAATITLVLAPSVLPAQEARDFSGEYVLLEQGQAVMTLKLRQDAGGKVRGSAHSAGKSLSLTGSPIRGRLTLVSAAQGGGLLFWEVTPSGAALSVSLVPPGSDGRPDYALRRTHLFERRTGRAPLGDFLAQPWIARLASLADTLVSWCAQQPYAENDLCRIGMPIVQRIAPALMVARLASGQAPPLVATIPVPTAAPTAEMTAEPVGEPATEERAEAVLEELASGEPPTGAETPDTAADEPAADAAFEPGTVPAAQAPTDWVHLERGTEVLALLYQPGEQGGVQGRVTVGGEDLPFSAEVSGGRFAFTTTAANGTTGEWKAAMQGGTMRLTLTTAEGSQTFDLRPRGAGWSETAPAARRWRAALESRAVVRSNSHSAGSSGGATSSFTLAFCSGGVATMESNSVVTVNVPGVDMSGLDGGQTSRESSRGGWRVVAQGETAAVEVTQEGRVWQLGLRDGDGVVVVGEQPMRLVDGSNKCD